MRSSNRLRILIVATSLLALPAVTSREALAQRGGDAAPPAFAERIEVRVINLEAVVVDRQGRRVRGLGPDDFLLRVDGKPASIDYFSEIADGLATEPAAERGEDLPPAAPGATAAGQRVATSYLVFIDSYFTRVAARRNLVLKGIEENLARLGPEDRMAIVAFDGRRIEVLSSWSQSIEELRGALATARELPARGFVTGNLAGEFDRSVASEADTARILAEQDGGDGAALPPTIREDGLPTEICATIERLERRIGRAVIGVTAALRSFAQPPGRKVMMLLSGGWPRSAKDYLVGSQPFGALDCGEEGSAIYRPIFETANRLGYTLYPVDVPSPDAGTVTAAEDGGQLFQPGGASSGLVGGEALLSRTFEEHSTLRTLAAETGGAALIDGAADDAFDTLVDDTRTYYWLGFTPQWKGDDKSHKVELDVRTPGFEVRTRQGYVDLSRQTEISYVTESALLFGDLPGAQALGLELGSLPRGGRGKVDVPLRLKIPMDAIVMTPTEGGFAARLELRVAVVDDEGNRNEMPIVPVTLEGAALPPPGAHAVYETSIRIRRRPHEIVVSLFDPLSDTILAASGSLAAESGGG